MPIITKTICDGCGAEQMSENHWWLIKSTGSGNWLKITPLANISPEDIEPDDMLFCGEACAMKKVSEWMSARMATGHKDSGESRSL
jgi:hypothetical protein